MSKRSLYRTRPRLRVLELEEVDVPIQRLTINEVVELMRQSEIPVLARGHRGSLRQIRVLDAKEMVRGDLNLHSQA